MPKITKEEKALINLEKLREKLIKLSRDLRDVYIDENSDDQRDAIVSIAAENIIQAGYLLHIIQEMPKKS